MLSWLSSGIDIDIDSASLSTQYSALSKSCRESCRAAPLYSRRHLVGVVIGLIEICIGLHGV